MIAFGTIRLFHGRALITHALREYQTTTRVGFIDQSGTRVANGDWYFLAHHCLTAVIDISALVCFGKRFFARAACWLWPYNGRNARTIVISAAAIVFSFGRLKTFCAVWIGIVGTRQRLAFKR